jgi:UDP-N-acetylmuramoyl-L-alanyl-D-glutamate--2,6-diaminopimelate ligase
MQPVGGTQPFRVFVDFAHTPQALDAVLRTLREAAPARVLVAFGHAGGRTASNRELLGSSAARLADYFVITSDDAYPEEPAAIAAAIEAGARGAGASRGRHYEVILDRQEAIRQLLGRAQPGDAVLLAGKGHESFLRVGQVSEPWNDVAIAAELLGELGFGPAGDDSGATEIALTGQEKRC